MNSKERCLAAINGTPTDRAPVFPLLMFFAQDRLGVTYRQFATDGRVTAEAQLKALEEFGFDAVTACTDAFRLTADLGAEMVYPEDGPPHSAGPLVRTEQDLLALRRPDPAAGRMADRALAVSQMASAVADRCLVLGWIDMPFAEACNICHLSDFMMMMYDRPALAHQVLEFLTDIVIDFALSQLAAGAHMLGAGDAATSLISPEFYREFALPYEQRVCQAIRQAGGMTKLHICGNTTSLLDDMVTSGAELYNLDHMVDFTLARDAYDKAGLCFKGNIDPVTDMLRATAEQCQPRCFDCLGLARNSRFMLSPGCEVPAATTDEVFTTFCQAPRAFAESQ